MASIPTRNQTSFRLPIELLEELQAVAKRTKRTPRQTLEIAVAQILPLLTSGFLDSSHGNEIMQKLENRRAHEKFLSSVFPGDVRLGKVNRPAVFRLEANLLHAIQSAAQATHRSDRAVVEVCLRVGLPMVGALPVLGAKFRQLLEAWETEGNGGKKESVEIGQTVQEFLFALTTAIDWKPASEAELEDEMLMETVVEDLTAPLQALSDAIFTWRKQSGARFKRSLPNAMHLERSGKNHWKGTVLETNDPKIGKVSKSIHRKTKQ